MKQTYDNYYRDYYNSPRGRVAMRRAQNRYRRKRRQLIKEGKLMGAKGTNLTEQDFVLIKELLSMNVGAKRIRELTGRSANTVWMISQVETFGEYRKKRQSYNQPRQVSPTAKFARAVEDLNLGERDLSKPDPELLKALHELTEAMNALALSWNQLSARMDEVLETKRPWMFGMKGK